MDKRVNCLYRVSTIGQVEKNDIPMQKQYCREFVAAHGDWKINKELYEKGISGFKKSAKDRDAIQELQADAVQGKFDILLVYMFDRLGRKDDETPFVVEWFVKNGIEVWSAVEGQQRFDNHVDKLLNYIRYWQASGESIKTSVRVKTRLEQLTEEGIFTGGTIPYGYKLEKRGRVNKRNREVGDLVIDEDAAEIIKLIFYKYAYEGFGAQRLCKYLASMSIYKADGRNFPNTTINRILKNELYTGIIHNGEVKSERIPELQIIDQKTFDRAQEIMQSRTMPRSDVPLNLKGSALVSGKIYCGHCGSKLALTTSGRRRKKKDGTEVSDIRPRYACFYKPRHPGECDGQSGYGVKKVDEIVDEVVRMQLQRIKSSPDSSIIENCHRQAVELAQAKCNITQLQLKEKQRELADYRAETIRVIRGESSFSASLLNDLIEQATEECAQYQEAAEQEQREYEEVTASSSAESDEYDTLVSWADIYDTCSFETKKMFVSQFIKSIHIFRDYRMEIEFNVSFEEFRNMVSEAER